MFVFRSSSVRIVSALVAGATFCVVGLLSAQAQQPKTAEKAEIPGGIEGKVKSVDQEKQKLSIVTSSGRERTFSITEDTTMLGPRGGKVRRRLNDPRFHEGMELTVVANSGTATEIHLGISRSEPADSPIEKSSAKSNTPREESEKAPAVKAKARARAKAKAAMKDEDADDGDDDEIPGKVKSFDSERRILVVTLLNGKSRSFLLARDVKVLVKGAASKQGLRDPAIKEGILVTVVVAEGGRRVRELHITPLAAAKTKKAA
jgi:hypothetical protein